MNKMLTKMQEHFEGDSGKAYLALGLVKGDRHYSYTHIDLAYDIDHVDEFMAWMKHARYERKHKYA